MLDPAKTTTELAAAASTALVKAMADVIAQDGWAVIRDSVARLFGQGDQLREQQTAERLDSTRETLRSGQGDHAAATQGGAQSHFGCSCGVLRVGVQAQEGQE